MKQGSVFFVSGRITGSPETDLNVSLSNILKTPAELWVQNYTVKSQILPSSTAQRNFFSTKYCCQTNQASAEEIWKETKHVQRFTCLTSSAI